jgi:hypothetical protein
MNTPQAATARGLRGRWQIVLLAVIFLGPVVGATLLFFSGWRPAGQVNHGELIEPARMWPAVALRDADGKPVPAEPWSGRWNLLYVAGDDCDAACESALDLMYRLHLAQGKDANRVARALVVLGTPHANLAAVLARSPGTVAWIAAPGTAPAWETYFSAGAAGAADGSIRFVDPRGYYMMRFTAGSDPNGIRRDLARLLKLSKES